MVSSRLASVLAAVLAATFQAGPAAADTVASTDRYCDASFSLSASFCLAAFSSTTGVAFRVAVPDVAAAPFDTLLQIVAPVATGWAGLAWGGAMTANPLTVAWPSGDAAIVSSRWAT